MIRIVTFEYSIKKVNYSILYCMVSEQTAINKIDSAIALAVAVVFLFGVFSRKGTSKAAFVTLISKYFPFENYLQAYRYIDAQGDLNMKVIIDI